MKTTHVSMEAAQAAIDAGRPSLAPELMASVFARYSRSNDGLDSIMQLVDKGDQKASIDRIFKMADYGHQSILDMASVAITLEDISIFMAYWVWSLTPTASGQESSTRYIKMDVESLGAPEDYGIPEEKKDLWLYSMKRAFENYEKAVQYWTSKAEANPDIMKLPKSVLEDTSEKGMKVLDRMRRNFVFDRARYFLPVAAKTNMVLIMPARGWARLIRTLRSSGWVEAVKLGDMLAGELELVSPNSVRHSTKDASYEYGWELEFSRWMRQEHHTFLEWPDNEFSMQITPSQEKQMREDLKVHNNRYSYIGSQLCRVPVSMRIREIAMAELRDLNRHRTGNKWCPLVPQGFYGAQDQLPELAQTALRAQVEMTLIGQNEEQILEELPDFIWAYRQTMSAGMMLRHGDPSYIYWTLLGTQFPFEHVTTFDKAIYELELRTGPGSHFRYAKHMRDWLAVIYHYYPVLKGLILEGSAEPE
jgi:thymidylate synthase ThyX